MIHLMRTRGSGTKSTAGIASIANRSATRRNGGNCSRERSMARKFNPHIAATEAASRQCLKDMIPLSVPESLNTIDSFLRNHEVLLHSRCASPYPEQMDPRHLELLRQLDERGSVTAVAQATFRTPSAVSQQLKAATREFGRTLVEPAGRGVRLTAAGRLVAAGGRQVASAIAEVQADWEDYLGEATGEVRIAGLPSALTYLIPTALTTLRATSPQIIVHTLDVDLAEHEFAGLLADVDLVIAHSLISARPVGTDGLTVEPLATEPIDVAVAKDHPLAGRTRLRPNDLVDAQWIG